MPPMIRPSWTLSVARVGRAADVADPWEEATFTGHAAAQARRFAQLTPQERLDWLEAVLHEAERAGVLAEVRRRRHASALKAWESTAP